MILFKHFVKKSLVDEFLSQRSPPLPAQTNPLVKQKQASAIGTRTPIPSTLGHFPKVTKVASMLEQEDWRIHYHKRPNLATKIKQVSNVPQTQNTSYQLQDPQYESNHSIVGEVNEITTEQVTCRPQKPKHEFHTNTKQRRHQHRLCYKCRQTGHFIKNCPQFTDTEN